MYGTGVPLYNASGRVVLKSTTGAVVDRVDWSAATRLPDPARAVRSRSPSRPATTRSAPTGASRSTASAPATSAAPAPPTRASDPRPLLSSRSPRSCATRPPSATASASGSRSTTRPRPTSTSSGWAIDDGASDFHTVRGSLVVAGWRLRRDRPVDRHRPQRWCGGRLLVRRRVRARQRRRLGRPPRRPRPCGRRGRLGPTAPRGSDRTVPRWRSSTAAGASPARSSAPATAARPGRQTTAAHCPIATS